MFLTGKRSEDRSPYGDFFFQPVGMNTAAGVRVSADSAMSLSAVYASVRLIANHMASLPFCLYTKRADGGKDRNIDHWLYKLMALRPNKFHTPFEFRQLLYTHLELRGNAYCQIVADARGRISDLIPLHPDGVAVELLVDGGGVYTGDYRYRVTNRNGSSQVLARGDVWHLKGLSSDGIIGLSPVALARNSLSIGMSAQMYGARFFANDAKPSGGWIEYPGTYKDKTQKEQVRESIQDAQSGKNRGKIMLLDHGLKYHEVGLSNDDAQFLQTRQFETSEIARWFGVPPHKIGDLSKSTNNNIEQQALEFVQDGLGPRAEAFESSIETHLLDDASLDVELLFSGLLRGDTAARTARYHGAVLDGYMTRNEVRISEGMNPLPGLDEPLRPLNMVEEGSEETPKANPAPTPALKNAEPGDPSESARRLQTVISGNAARLARRIVKAEGKLPEAELVAESLGVSIDAVHDWNACRFLTGMTETEVTAALMALAA